MTISRIAHITPGRNTSFLDDDTDDANTRCMIGTNRAMPTGGATNLTRLVGTYIRMFPLGSWADTEHVPKYVPLRIFVLQTS